MGDIADLIGTQIQYRSESNIHRIKDGILKDIVPGKQFAKVQVRRTSCCKILRCSTTKKISTGQIVTRPRTPSVTRRNVPTERRTSPVSQSTCYETSGYETSHGSPGKSNPKETVTEIFSNLDETQTHLNSNQIETSSIDGKNPIELQELKQNAKPDLIPEHDSKEIQPRESLPVHHTDERVSSKYDKYRDIFHRNAQEPTIDEQDLQGIQGCNNSCYMDACLFAMYSFNTFFDHIFTRTVPKNVANGGIVNSLMWNLGQKIVRPLREHGFVPLENLVPFRHLLADNIHPEYLDAFMDAEEFLVDLFELTKTPSFLEYTTGQRDYIHQVTVSSPMNQDDSEIIGYESLQSLMEKSFSISNVKLRSKPRKTFILKMPVSSGKLLGCKGVIPNLTLDLNPILSPDSDKEHNNNADCKMTLSAVICLKNSHFVSFAKTGKNDASPWLFMDSNPTQSRPEVIRLDDLAQLVENSLEKIDGNENCDELEEPGVRDYNLFQDAYICIYV